LREQEVLAMADYILALPWGLEALISTVRESF
jgi:hypothetical protein